MPSFGILFAEMLALYFRPKGEVFEIPDTFVDEIMSHVVQWVVIFIGVGIGVLILNIGMSTLFGIAGERLTSRLRQLSFKVRDFY